MLSAKQVRGLPPAAPAPRPGSAPGPGPLYQRLRKPHVVGAPPDTAPRRQTVRWSKGRLVDEYV